MGSSVDDAGHAITIDNFGDVYVAGTTYGSLDGNTNAGDADLFVAKYDSDGNSQWTRQVGTNLFDGARGITSDGAGDLYITGATVGNLDGNFAAGGEDIFIIKYSTAGVKQWTQQMGGSSQDHVLGITSDSLGDIYISGKTNGSLDGNANSGDYDLFVVKYYSAGVKQWTQQMGSSNYDYATAVVADSSNSIYVFGETSGNLDGNTSLGGRDFFLIKYDSAGNKQWTQQMGSSSREDARGITVDMTDNVCAIGSTEASLDGSINAGGKDIILMKLK